MDIQQSIATLTGCGWSQRRIARELGINRETVAKYRLAARKEALSKPAIVPTGSMDSSDAKPAILPAGPGPGRKSQCEPFREEITVSWEAGLSAHRIYQDLTCAADDGG